MDSAALAELTRAFHRDDAGTVRTFLARSPELKQLINAPVGPFDSPPIVNVRSKEMLDVLLDFGANINAKSQWWAGGFCLLDSANDDLARYAIERGAHVEVHAAARLGMLDRLRELVANDPSLVNALGGDGKRPLHFARNVEVARFLLDHGAEIDALDIDHESTPAQHLIDEHQDVVRFVIERGAKTDLFLAAALGELALIKKHLAENPNSIRQLIDNSTFPMRNPRAGGTIYFWTLGREISPHQVAKKFGREEAVKFLMEQSPAEIRLINYCWFGDEAAVKKTLAENPDLKVSASAGRAVADAARGRNLSALRLILDAGAPIDARGQHNATALHWAAWHGHAEAVKLLLERRAPLELTDNDFQATPLQWAMHGSENGWHCDEGDYPEVARLLLDAGAETPQKITGTKRIREAISKA
ncbi:MAG TPA: ankyrin repeat domain-containing protein [Verrucomicrobiae bacterium]